MCRLSGNSRSLNLVESQGPVQACSGKALPLPSTVYCRITCLVVVCTQHRFIVWSTFCASKNYSISIKRHAPKEIMINKVAPIGNWLYKHWCKFKTSHSIFESLIFGSNFFAGHIYIVFLTCNKTSIFRSKKAVNNKIGRIFNGAVQNNVDHPAVFLR